MAHKITIVDDNPKDAEVLETLLRKTGEDLEVETILDPEEGRQKLSLLEFDTAFVDVHLDYTTINHVLQGIEPSKRNKIFAVSSSPENAEVADLPVEALIDKAHLNVGLIKELLAA